MSKKSQVLKVKRGQRILIKLVGSKTPVLGEGGKVIDQEASVEVEWSENGKLYIHSDHQAIERGSLVLHRSTLESDKGQWKETEYGRYKVRVTPGKQPSP